MRLPVSNELRDKFFHDGTSLFAHLHNLHRLRPDDIINFLSGDAGLIPQINRERAADDDERQQQRDHLAAQCRDLIRQFGRWSGIHFRFVHGNQWMAGFVSKG